MPEWVHIVCSTTRARDIIDEARSIILPGIDQLWSGKLVWEPLPVSPFPPESMTARLMI